MLHLSLRPDAEGYQRKEGNNVVSTNLDGGPSRTRVDKIGAPESVSVTWTLNPSQYRYIQAFWHTGIKKGAFSITCDLVSQDGTAPTPPVCKFIQDTFTLASQKGLTYVIQASLEVMPLPRDTALDDLTVSIGPDFAPELFVNLFEHLVLVTLPGELGA